jgi:serine/threonine-protein kinase
MIGKTVGKYRIIERLGRGGMGTVYKAVDETLDREVAIKVLNADLGDTDILKRFRAEAVTLARLNHPGIATLYELYRDDDDLLMVMEFVRGETLHELSERLGAVAAPQAAHLVMQVLDALSHAHRAGVVHRDLKPANLMLTETGSVKVMDFGIARVLGTEHFTQGGYMMGTPAYMAPEQVLGGDIDGRADLYAVGVVLYRLLSGQLPFSADTAIAMVQKQVNESPTPIAQFQPDLPPWCERVLSRALAKSPADRFQNADEFRAALLSAVQPQTMGELPTMATPTPPGLHVSSDATRMHTAAATLPARIVDPSSAVAVATPLAAAAPPAGATSQPQPTGSTRPIDPVGHTTTVVLGRKHLVGIGVIAALIVVALAGVGWYALRKSSFPQQLQIGAVPAEEAKPSTEQPQTPPPADQTAAAAQPEAGQPGAAVPAPPAAPGAPAVPAPPKPGDSPTTAAGSPKTPGRGTPADGAQRAGARGATPAPPAVETATNAAPASPSTSPSPKEPAAPPPPSAATPVTFKDVRLLVKDGDKSKELNGVLALGDGHVAVLDKPGGSALITLPYSALTGAAYSRSKQPKWKDTEGKEVEGKADLGKLGFLRSERNWVILLSHGDPVIFRVEDSSIRAVLPAIENHTGLKVRR